MKTAGRFSFPRVSKRPSSSGKIIPTAAPVAQVTPKNLNPKKFQTAGTPKAPPIYRTVPSWERTAKSFVRKAKNYIDAAKGALFGINNTAANALGYLPSVATAYVGSRINNPQSALSLGQAFRAANEGAQTMFRGSVAGMTDALKPFYGLDNSGANNATDEFIRNQMRGMRRQGQILRPAAYITSANAAKYVPLVPHPVAMPAISSIGSTLGGLDTASSFSDYIMNEIEGTAGER